MSKPEGIENFTFKEYFSDPQRQNQKEFIISILAHEGFSEEQLNEMNMKRVWNLFLDATKEVIEHDLTAIEHILMTNPEAARNSQETIQSLTEWLKKQTEKLEQKLEKEKGPQ